MELEWPVANVLELQSASVLLVEDGNHGEYRPRPSEFGSEGVAFIRAADMNGGSVLFHSADKINETARNRIRNPIGTQCLLGREDRAVNYYGSGRSRRIRNRAG